MGGVELWAAGLWNEPMLRDRDAVHRRAAAILLRGPFVEIDRAWKWRQQHELGEGQIRTFGESDGRVERFPGIARQPEDERAEHMNPMTAKRPQPRDQVVSTQVEALVY